ncbi:glycosyltransferase [Desulfallas thermosapovorans]|uniref:Glycosyltransferase 2-like domain-containing protein n=1 Tax=Desulfallas thermosapovorans DSM 6562 TaxID=1121431 RepID=A0A5S4ZVX2_9FIRM|nr:glycosyltransferase [Desulfallas thermosapovorans]TYO96998.1 hypothetical protein LX24_00808 [Desulfallas thermosapovorans DSM 6562]
MFIAVIPAKNEAKSLGKVIANLPTRYLDCIIPVLNGCTDNSLEVLENLNCPLLAPLWFDEPLGIDVPRAVGAMEATRLGADGILFIDGDMAGASEEMLTRLVLAVQNQGLDLALTNCYPHNARYAIRPPAACLLKLREELNRHLQLFHLIGTATPSHGPHAVSGRLLRLANPTDFAIPPLLLARAARAGLAIGIAAETTHLHLGSPLRGAEHTRKITETIIGDCLSALRAKNDQIGHRMLDGRAYIGYHHERRWDLLKQG